MLKDKIVLVTGGGNGIGFAMVELFVLQGAFVIVVDKDLNANAKMDALNKLQRSVDFVCADISNPDEVHKLKDYITANYKCLDAVVNNAAKMYTADFYDSKLEEIDAILNLNLKSVFYISQVFSQFMLERKKGVILNVSSTHAKLTLPGHEIYAAAKAGIAAMSRSMALSLGKFGIRVNTLIPGLTMTENIAEHIQSIPGLGQAYQQMSPTNRNTSVTEVARVAAFLISDLSSGINAQEIVVDQGESAQAYCIDQLGTVVKSFAAP